MELAAIPQRMITPLGATVTPDLYLCWSPLLPVILAICVLALRPGPRHPSDNNLFRAKTVLLFFEAFRACCTQSRN